MKQKYKFAIGGAIILGVLTLLSIQGIQEMTVYFYTPTEVLASATKLEKETIRIGALVKSGSVTWNEETLHLAFDITENSKDFIPVVYQGVKPDMFREGQGVVVEGKIQQGVFYAHQLLVKHSEEYTLPPENHAMKKEQYYQSLVE